MNLKIKKLHPAANLPKYATPGALAFDLHAFCDFGPHIILPGHQAVINTGLAFDLPHNVGLAINSRSGHGFNAGVRLANGQGWIDSDYKGEIKICLRNDGARDFIVRHGDRIAQVLPITAGQVGFEEVTELAASERGQGGFGSTGQ